MDWFCLRWMRLFWMYSAVSEEDAGDGVARTLRMVGARVGTRYIRQSRELREGRSNWRVAGG